jgi:hypothetical protein
MPVISMLRLAGDPDQLVARLNEHVEPVTGRLAPAHGGLLNIVARDGDDGIVIVNLWETDEGRHAMAAEPDVQEALRNADFPQPSFEGFEVVAIRADDRLAEHVTALG